MGVGDGIKAVRIHSVQNQSNDRIECNTKQQREY
jgi:hypothetical protein